MHCYLQWQGGRRRHRWQQGLTFWQRAALRTLRQVLLQQPLVSLTELGMTLCPSACQTCTALMTKEAPV